MRKLILASGSPRRKELLELAGLEFEVMVSHAEEIITKTEPGEIVEELSRCKALAVAELLEENAGDKEAEMRAGTKGTDESAPVILGADTVVVLDGQILGKPADEADAKRMLNFLQGRTHQVYTGVTFVCGGQVWSFHEKSDVTVYPMTEEEIDGYLSTGEPMDKAGAYGIQGRFAIYIQGIQGDYYNIVGLPIARVWQELKKRYLHFPGTGV